MNELFMVNEAKIIYNAKVQPLWLNGLARVRLLPPLIALKYNLTNNWIFYFLIHN